MKINKILSVGCSNTVGVNLEEEIGIFEYLRKEFTTPVDKDLDDKVNQYRKENNFSTLISKHFNSECINLGVSGASNERIIFNTTKYLEENDVDLILVNLSGQARQTFQHKNGKTFDLDLSYDTQHLYEQAKITEKGFIEFIDFYKDYLMTPYVTHDKQINLYKYISLYLEDRGIPYLITQTVPTDFKLSHFTKNCIDITFDEFNETSGRKRAHGYHWLSDSHKAWAELLIDKIHKLYGTQLISN